MRITYIKDDVPSCNEAYLTSSGLNRPMALMATAVADPNEMKISKIYLTRRYADMNRDSHFCVPLNKKLQIIDTPRSQNQGNRIQELAIYR